MLKKVLIIFMILFLTSTKVLAVENIDVEIFDINKNCVIKTVQVDSSVQRQVEEYFKGITGIYAKFDPIPDKGYMVRVPLEKPVMIKNKWINTFVEETIIIFPQNEKAYLMVFDNKDRVLFFSFEGNTNLLLKNLNFHLKQN